MIKTYILNLKTFNLEINQENAIVKKYRERVISYYFKRMIISKHTTFIPNQIQFNFTKEGKPYLKSSTYAFNTSHTKKYIAIAITTHNASIGIDVQNIKKKIAALNIAKRYYTKSEYLILQMLPYVKRKYYFCLLWTLKEAAIKLIGNIKLLQNLSKISFENKKIIVAIPIKKNIYYESKYIDENTILSIAYLKQVNKENNFKIIKCSKNNFISIYNTHYPCRI